MLSSHDQRRFNEIVSGLLAEHPGLATSFNPPERNLRPRPIVAVLLWLSTPFMVAVGGWTGLLVAIAAGGYAAHLWFRGHSLRHGQPHSQ